ncbi:MAG: tetratricopeptide repeat protein, partial [Calditrichae bacterium]|nr:tetratricopeptide repeat protein [Calditrichia bacterium]NIW80720.1 tetratricopeptide repeat protein [Calditrichia bacterium]
MFGLNPNSFYGFALQGQIHNGRGKIQESVRALKRAMSIEPNNPDVLQNLAYNYLRSGKAVAARP